MIRVLLADDQALVRTGFRLILSAEPGLEVVGEAADGRQVIDLARRTRPDVVLMDIRMPVLDGIEATRVLAGPDAADPVKVVILTTFDLDEYVVEALRAGASGFLLKDTPPEDLVRAIEIVSSGDALLAPSITRRLLERFAADRTGTTPSPEGMAELTDREREVMLLVARGLTNGEIADRLVLGETTVKTHVSRILSKLDLRDRVQIVVVAYEAGLIRPGEGEAAHPTGG